MGKTEFTRRSVLDNFPQSGWGNIPVPDRLAGIPLAEQQIANPRPRGWEQQHRGKSYRGIPKALHDTLKEIALNHTRSVDVVAEAFLEYALVCYRRGDLTLDPLLHQGRRTVLHTNGRVWDEHVWGLPPSSETPQRKRKASSDSWRRVVTYRLSPDVIQAIHWFAGQHEVPAGEIVTYLLSHALDAYKAGRLVINPAK